MDEFQSSPGLLAGRYQGVEVLVLHGPGFNPRPAFWPGATARTWPVARPGGGFNPRPAFWPGVLDHRPRTGNANQVSILARPFGRALLGKAGRSFFLLGVSILARPFGRALHVFGSGVGSRLSGFQSSPGLLAGRYVHDLTWLATGSKVSILARPFGRALTLRRRRRWRWTRCFNPRPAFWPGADRLVLQPGERSPCFNPRPAFWPGADVRPV